jgi:hypothetical protein
MDENCAMCKGIGRAKWDRKEKCDWCKGSGKGDQGLCLMHLKRGCRECEKGKAVSSSNGSTEPRELEVDLDESSSKRRRGEEEEGDSDGRRGKRRDDGKQKDDEK